MRLCSLPSVPPPGMATLLKASASFCGRRPAESAAACAAAKEGEAAAATAAIRLESLANGSFSAERPAAPLQSAGTAESPLAAPSMQSRNALQSMP